MTDTPALGDPVVKIERPGWFPRYTVMVYDERTRLGWAGVRWGRERAEGLAARWVRLWERIR